MSTEGEPQGAESKYELREVIGKGAFGEVNLVVEKQSKQRFVLKRIKMARQSEWQRKATRQEIEIVSRLKHPFIMPYKEHWTHHGHTINVVYGYCEKGDLTTAIAKQKGKLFPEETLRLWLAQLLLAVEYMHRANVLHRDIKPQNILLTGEGDVQIGDFGLSTVRVPSGEAAHAQLHAHPLSFTDDTDTRTDASPLPHRQQDGSSGGAATPEHGKPPHHAAHTQAGPDPLGHIAGDADSHHPHMLLTAPPGQGHTAQGGHGHTPAHGNASDKDKDRDKDQLGAQTPVHDPKAGTRNDYALVGTPHFMSPELLSSQKYSFETDIWSLGVVMFELTTLKPPFNAFNLAGLMAKIKRAALPPVPPGYSSDWAALLRGMLRKEPVRRATALELLTLPSMQKALQQAYTRARAIDPKYTLPAAAAAALAAAPPSPAPDAFSFDIGAPGGAGAAQRTPVATPVLTRAGPGSGGAQSPGEAGADSESDSSPMSKFPDLGAAATAAAAEREPPHSASHPPRPMVRSTTAPRLHAAQAAAATASGEAKDSGRSKTPGLARGRAGTTVGAPPPAALVRRPPTPQAARPVTVTARSKTPARAGAATPGAALSPRGRPGRAAPPRASGGEDTPATGGRLVRKASIPQEARGRTAGTHAAATTPPKAEGEHKARAAGVPPLALAAIMAPEGAEANEAPAAAGDADSALASTPTSLAGSLRSQNSGAGASITASRPKEQPPLRATRTQSFTTRTTRPSPAAGVPGAPISASSPTAAGASGQKRRVAAAAAQESTPPSLHASNSARFRTATASAAGAPPTPGSAVDRRRSQSGATTSGAKDGPDSAAPREKRVRRSSYVTYGRPGVEGTPPPARRQTGAPSPEPIKEAASEQSTSPSAAEGKCAQGADAAVASGSQAAAAAAEAARAAHFASSGGCSAGGCSVESMPIHPADAVRGAPASSDPAGGDAAAAPQAVGTTSAGDAAGGLSGHPWRAAPRARSFMSMTTEDSELSIPDGRYAISPQVSTGGGGEVDGPSGAGAARPVHQAVVPTSAGGATPAFQPYWSSNQLYTDSSVGGATAEAVASAADMAAADMAAREASGEPSGAAAAEPTRRQDPLGQSIELPRRVSISAFSPHLLKTAGGEVVASPGGDSTAESSPVVATARQQSAGGGLPEAAEPAAAADEAAGTAPGAGTPSTPKAFAAPDSPGSFSSLSAPASDSSPSIGLSPRLGAELHMLSPRLAAERGSPVAAAPQPQARRRLQATAGQGYGAGRPFRRPGRVAQQAVMRSQRELENAIKPAADASGMAAPQRPAGGGLFDEPSFGGSLGGGSSTASAQRSFSGFAVHAAQSQEQAGPAAWRLAVNASSSAAGSSADATSTLRPVAEEAGDEAESAPAAGGATDAGGGGGSALGASEREQLALLQRVVSVAGSLLEAGRVDELYNILSSTLARPLARPAAAAPKRPDLEDRVRLVTGPFRGTEAVVRFRGPCHWCTGEVLGLELPPSDSGDEAASPLRGAAAEACAAGVRDGVIYFRCQAPKARTTFVAPDLVALLS